MGAGNNLLERGSVLQLCVDLYLTCVQESCCVALIAYVFQNCALSYFLFLQFDFLYVRYIGFQQLMSCSDSGRPSVGGVRHGG